MAAIVGCSSQKGGVSKGTIARGLAVAAAAAGLQVEVIDTDVGQATLAEWARDRAAAGITPAIKVHVTDCLRAALVGINPETDLVIVDGPARADESTVELAQHADLIVQPTGASLDDLRPAVRAFNSLSARGIPRSRLLMVLSRIGSPAEAAAARDYLTEAGYTVADGFIPEKVSYRVLQNTGRAIIEARHPSLRTAANKVIQSIINMAIAAASKEAAE